MFKSRYIKIPVEVYRDLLAENKRLRDLVLVDRQLMAGQALGAVQQVAEVEQVEAQTGVLRRTGDLNGGAGRQERPWTDDEPPPIPGDSYLGGDPGGT